MLTSLHHIISMVCVITQWSDVACGGETACPLKRCQQWPVPVCTMSDTNTRDERMYAYMLAVDDCLPSRAWHISPKFCFPHCIDGISTLVWLVMQLYTLVTFLIAHLAYFLSVLCHVAAFIGSLTGLNRYSKHRLHWVVLHLALDFVNTYLDCLLLPSPLWWLAGQENHHHWPS